jgi:hypothetical protein
MNGNLISTKIVAFLLYQAYIELKRFQHFHDDLHRDWLIGFDKSVGREEAQRLLKDVGKVSADHKSKPKQQNAMTPTPLSSPNEKNYHRSMLAHDGRQPFSH